MYLRSNYSHIKEKWTSEINSARELLKDISENFRQSLEPYVHSIEQKVKFHNGEPHEYVDINERIEKLHSLIKTILEWEKDISDLEAKTAEMESEAKILFASKAPQIQQKISVYKGKEPDKLEIDKSIYALDSAVMNADTLAKAKKNALTIQDDTEDSHENAAKTCSMFSFFFYCCLGASPPVSSRRLVINTNEDNSLKLR